jgi:hypothetical protein
VIHAIGNDQVLDAFATAHAIHRLCEPRTFGTITPALSIPVLFQMAKHMRIDVDGLIHQAR